MNISTKYYRAFWDSSWDLDELGIGRIIDRALPKTRHHKASHSAIIKAMALNEAVPRQKVPRSVYSGWSLFLLCDPHRSTWHRVEHGSDDGYPTAILRSLPHDWRLRGANP